MITSISVSILVPTCFHVGLQSQIFFDFWRFQEAFKISSFFASIFYRFWLRLGLQLGAILGAKTAQNRKNGSKKRVPQLPKSGSGYEPAFEDRSRASWPRFLGGQGSIFDDFWMIFRTCWLTLGMFSAAPDLDLVFVVLGQVFSQLFQENLRTCRGQSRESKNLPRTKPRTNSVQTPTRNIIAQNFVLLNSFPYRKPPYSKNVGRRYSPQGGFNPPPNWGRRVRPVHAGLLQTFRISSLTHFLTQRFLEPERLAFPLLNPPPGGSGRLHLRRRSTALARLGASWAEKIAFQEASKN